MNIQTKEDFKKAFDQLYNPLCNFSASILNDEAGAEDVVQEVFVRLWNKRNEINISGDFKSYVFQAVKNKSLEVLRKKKSDLNRIQMAANVAYVERDSPIEREMQNFMLKEKLYNSLRQLPPKCREIFEMSKLEGLTYVEIADVLKISTKTVETQMSRALKILRETLK